METFLIRALQLIMSLSLLVIIHEGGHFLFARLFKVRVEKFCLFFDPWFTLFKFKPKKSETEYAVGWLPLGGYVKIAGMIDESMDTEQMKQPEQPWEFRSKPAWQRLLIMVGGVLFNFLLALFIYSMILFKWGDQYYDPDMLSQIADAREVTVLREGKKASVYIPEDMMQRLLGDSVRFAEFRFPYVVDSVMVNSPAAMAGIQPGDSIIALDGKPVSYTDFLAAMAERRQNAKALQNDSINPHQISLTYVRDGKTDVLTLTTDSAFKIGVAVNPYTDQLLPVIRKEYGFFESFPAGVALGVKTLKGYVGNMKYLFSKEGAKQLGGFGTIGSIFPATWNWHQFWYMTAFLSIILAFMNILPIPALDGGHVLFLFYEIIARRKPSDKFMEYAQMAGMILLFGLLIWANFNDILRFFF